MLKRKEEGAPLQATLCIISYEITVAYCTLIAMNYILFFFSGFRCLGFFVAVKFRSIYIYIYIYMPV